MYRCCVSGFFFSQFVSIIFISYCRFKLVHSNLSFKYAVYAVIHCSNSCFILSIAATAMVVTCVMTLVTRIGPEHQKGVITGIFRSLGALARACGPIIASSGEFK